MTSSPWTEVWNCIHIIAKTANLSNEENQDAFVCFMFCLTDLLPSFDYKENFSNFIKTSPLRPTNNTTAFEWTYKLHSYCNLMKRKKGKFTNDITLSQSYQKYAFISKKEWGNAIWYLLHFISANLPRELPAVQQLSFKSMIVCLRYLLPCDECRNHMTIYLAENPLVAYLHNGQYLFTWTWKFHNEVNVRLKKPILDHDVAYAMYQQDILYTVL